MLEFYTINADYLESLSITEALFDSLCGTQVFQIPFKRVTMEDAFKLHAGFSLLEAIKKERLQFHAKALGLETRSGASAEELFNLIFIHSVEPKLRNERSLALIDYPAAVPCLAAPNPDGLTLQRWELYVKGIEMANCYSEETRAEAVKAYFEVQSEQKRLSARIPHNVDSDYWKIFQRSDSKTNLAYSGVAIGFDRLIMAICGLKNIDAILP
jgi:lysyl-tRNA synthetase class 2